MCDDAGEAQTNCCLAQITTAMNGRKGEGGRKRQRVSKFQSIFFKSQAPITHGVKFRAMLVVGLPALSRPVVWGVVVQAVHQKKQTVN